MDAKQIVGEAALQLMDQLENGEEVEGVFIVAATRKPNGTKVVRTAPSEDMAPYQAVGMVTTALDHLRGLRR